MVDVIHNLSIPEEILTSFVGLISSLIVAAAAILFSNWRMQVGKKKDSVRNVKVLIDRLLALLREIESWREVDDLNPSRSTLDRLHHALKWFQEERASLKDLPEPIRNLVIDRQFQIQRFVDELRIAQREHWLAAEGLTDLGSHLQKVGVTTEHFNQTANLVRVLYAEVTNELGRLESLSNELKGLR